jgi:hypothetical protein
MIDMDGIKEALALCITPTHKQVNDLVAEVERLQAEMDEPKAELRRRMKVAESELARLREGILGLDSPEADTLVTNEGSPEGPTVLWVRYDDIQAILKGDTDG